MPTASLCFVYCIVSWRALGRELEAGITALASGSVLRWFNDMMALSGSGKALDM